MLADQKSNQDLSALSIHNNLLRRLQVEAYLLSILNLPTSIPIKEVIKETVQLNIFCNRLSLLPPLANGDRSIVDEGR